MTGNTLTLKFKSKDDLEKVKQANKRIVLARTVTVEPASGQSWVVAWTAFEPRMTASLQWPDSYYVFATTVDPEATLQPAKTSSGGKSDGHGKSGGQDGDGQSQQDAKAGGDGNGNGNGGGTGSGKSKGNGNGESDRTGGKPPALFMLSPTAITLGLHYSMRDGDFFWTHPDNGIGQNSVKVFNAFDGGRKDGSIGIGLAQPLSAEQFTVPHPQPHTPDLPDCAPITVAKLDYNDAVTFTPGGSVKVALMQGVEAGHALKSLPGDALELSFDAKTSKHTATYDPDSGAFKADGGNGGNGDKDDKGGGKSGKS